MGRQASIFAVRALCLAWLPLSGPLPAEEMAASGETIASDAPDLRDVNGVLLRGGEPLAGEVVERLGDRLLSRTPYVGGKEHGVVEAWYPDGTLRHRKLYRFGHRQGTHVGFWPDGSVQFVHHYKDDLFEGEQVAFYKNGVPAELRRYHLGREEGQQRFFDGTGKLIGNYAFKDGKRYGIVGRFDCISMVESK